MTDEAFYARLSENAQQLFRSPFRDETRKRQAALLLSSAVAILLALNVLSPTAFSTGGLNAGFQNQVLAVKLSGYVTIYFIAVYLLGISEDITTSKYRAVAPVLNLNDEAQRLYELAVQQNARSNELLAHHSELSEDVSSRLESVDRVVRPIRERVSMLREQIMEIRSKAIQSRMTVERYDATEAQVRPLERELEELKIRERVLNRPREQLLEELERDDPRDSIREQIAAINEDNRIEAQLSAIRLVQRKHATQSAIRTALEVTFPVLFALTALYFVFVRPFVT